MKFVGTTDGGFVNPDCLLRSSRLSLSPLPNRPQVLPQ